MKNKVSKIEMNLSGKNKPLAIDLFSGAGGLSVGLKKAGFRVIAGIENNEAAAKTYKMNHRKHILYCDDIRIINPYDVMKDLKIESGELDLLAGCPPCQGFSTHRTRNKCTSVEDQRNDLVYEFYRFVRAMKPKTIMMENVPGLAKDSRIVSLQRKLEKLGYTFGENSITVKDVSNYGVPQRRRRMILLASRFGEITSPKECKIKQTVFDAIGSLDKPGKTGDYLHDHPVSRSQHINSLISLIPKDGGSRSELPKEYWLPCHIRYPEGYKDVYGRMSWHKVSPTITGGCTNPSKGRFLHPSQNRAITMREAALLQSFPPNYKFSLEKGKEGVSLMIGNALPPEFIRRHAVCIKKHLEKAA